MAGTQADGSADELELEQSSASKWKISQKDVLRPVTLRQLLKAQRDPATKLFVLNGRSFQSVRIVATIREENINRSYATYKLDDGTINPNQPLFASLSGIDSDEYAPLLPRSERGVLPSLRYVSIVGRVDESKFGGGKNFLRIDYMRPVADPHEPYYHALEVVKTELMYERGPPPGSIVRREPEANDNKDVKGKGRQVDSNSSDSSDSDDDDMYEPSVLKDHPTNTPAPARTISAPRAPRHSPHDLPSIPSAPHTPTKPSRSTSTRAQAPTSPTGAMGSLNLNSPAGAAEASATQAGSKQTRFTTGSSTTVKGRWKDKGVATEPTPTPPAPESRREIWRDASATSPSVSGTGSLALNSPGSKKTRSASSTATSTGKSKGKGAATESSSTPESPTPDSRRAGTRAATAAGSSSSRASTSSTPASPATERTTNNRRPQLSTRDPLSHLTLLQRSILLKIKEDGGSGGVHIRVIAQHVKRTHSQDNISYSDTINALEFLEQADLIEAVDDEFEYYRAKDVKGKRSAYEIPRE
ncbi:hypothetical protein BC629DRAFT_1589697 [Irpex lacteus]|nr:hypothetical protein BC629DRAFT_1589697 [Irpex lacteus]